MCPTRKADHEPATGTMAEKHDLLPRQARGQDQICEVVLHLPDIVDISTYHLRNERRLGSDAEGRQFRRQFRVKREIAYKLINDLHRQLCMRPKRTRSDSVSPSEAVLMYLSYCSEKGGSANKVEALFGRGVSTVHKWVDEVAVAISNQYYDTEIRKPTKQEATEIMEWFV